MKRDPLPATVLASKLIPNATPKMVQDLIAASGLDIEYDPVRHRSLALVTADCDDVTYTALDEATKKADVEVIYARSFYGGAANANTKLAGEILGVLAGPNPAEARSGLEACCDFIENEAHFVSANEDDTIPYYAHCISRTGSYLSRSNGIEEGEAIAYLIAPPLEAMYAIDAAVKAADVSIIALYNPPSETNFGGGLLTGTQSACKAACDAFAAAVEFVADQPKE
ncbi:MAG: ethanolamine utilization microcompartment protein EutL [Lachnospiraceae bacterium]|nr:ethanolamine utilization microcompartment protein EutL [Lachnospiraceae bacterium]